MRRGCCSAAAVGKHAFWRVMRRCCSGATSRRFCIWSRCWRTWRGGGAADADTIAAVVALGELYQRQGNATKAEQMYRRGLDLQPNQSFALRNLTFLLILQGRRRESLPLLLRSIKRGDFTFDDLLLLGEPRALLEGEQVDRFDVTDADNPMWWLARAQLDFRNSRSEAAIRSFRRVTAVLPTFPEGQAGLGLALLDAPDSREFWRWHQEVPPEASVHADYWIALGLWAQRHAQQRAAIRCFWEALRCDASYRLASYQLSVALVTEGELEAAKIFEQHAAHLRALGDVLDELFTTRRNNVTTMLVAAERLEALGRFWEAAGWHHLVLTLDSENAASRMAMARLRPLLGDELPRIAPGHDPAKRVDFSSYPLPEIAEPAAVLAGPAASSASSPIRFADVTPSSGLDFSYFNGEDPATPGRRMFEFTGGGVAVMDYDQDGWPDIYFTQGAYWPRRAGEPVLRDQLFRNLGNGRFANVTESAGLGDDRFGQGVTSGDFNADGYPDLLVGNVGPNRLYVNNGDGTFAEVADQVATTADAWTTSCMIADLDGDSLADIFEVNYLAGNTAELMCRQTCSPAQFPAQADRFLHNQGDGTFVDRTLEAGFNGQDGKGLGVVAFDFNDSGTLSVFVSNDTTANFFYINDQPPGTPPKYIESAMVQGLAFDREGQAQACMGIAVGDANADGLLDVFIANFFHEFNVLYEQMPGGFFADVSRECGLAEPSYSLLTFGTEFIDMDLDGDPDIIATNGHVDDFRDSGTPYHMLPKVFENSGGNFVERGETCGPFFEGAYLGRSLAVLDWNRDGKGDWVVSHLDSPAAILENQTEPAGHYLGITCVGTVSERDATGTTCWITFAGRTTMQQLVGGGGYNACDEKLMLFGLGTATVAERVELRWPTGQRQVFEQVAGDRVYRIIEGRDALSQLPLDR